MFGAANFCHRRSFPNLHLKLKKDIEKGPDPEVAKKEFKDLKRRSKVIKKKILKLGTIGKMKLEAGIKFHNEDDSTSSSEED